MVLYRLTAVPRRRLLWRVRRKLIISYIFIGFVPALLIVAFFILAGLLLFFNVSAHVMETQMRAIEDEARYMARAVAIDLQSARSGDEITARLTRAATADQRRYPLVSYAAVPVSGRCTDPAGETIHLDRPHVAGAWAHQPAPGSVPEWVPCGGYGGLIPYRAGDHTQVAVRGVGWPIDASGFAVVVDLPLGGEVVHRFRDETGIEIRSLTMLTKSSFMTAAVSASSKDSWAITWHQWQAEYPTDRSTGRSALPGRGERLFSPRVPVHGVVGVLAQVGARLVGQSVHGPNLGALPTSPPISA